MKILFLIAIVLVAFMLPMKAQGDQTYDLTENVPNGAVKISKPNELKSIDQAINAKFDKNNPATWSAFPHTLKEYGWLYDFGNSEHPTSQYEVIFKSRQGEVMDGTYNVEGDLIKSTEVSKNIPIPGYIMDALFQSQYKDWQIVGDKEVVKFYNTSDKSVANQDFMLKVEKDNKIKKLTFNYEAEAGKLQARLVK